MTQRNTSVAFNLAISQTLNATKEHKRSYQPSYSSDSKCHKGIQGNLKPWTFSVGPWRAEDYFQVFTPGFFRETFISSFIYSHIYLCVHSLLTPQSDSPKNRKKKFKLGFFYFWLWGTRYRWGQNKGNLKLTGLRFQYRLYEFLQNPRYLSSHGQVKS